MSQQQGVPVRVPILGAAVASGSRCDRYAYRYALCGGRHRTRTDGCRIPHPQRRGGFSAFADTPAAWRADLTGTRSGTARSRSARAPAGASSLCVANAARCRACCAAAHRPDMEVRSRTALCCAPALRRCGGPVRSTERLVRKGSGRGAQCGAQCRRAPRPGCAVHRRQRPLRKAPPATVRSSPRPAPRSTAQVLPSRAAHRVLRRRVPASAGRRYAFSGPVKRVPVDRRGSFPTQTGARAGGWPRGSRESTQGR